MASLTRKKMNIDTLLENIRNTPDCHIYPATTLPVIQEEHLLPDDLRRFYTLCGGATLFDNSGYDIRIVSPEEVTLANPIIVGELYPEDISSTWYILAKMVDSDFITIDLSRERCGRCYASFWDVHGVAGSCPIIARAFIDFLSETLLNRGQYWYWLQPGFKRIGDAYDELLISR